MMPLLVCMCINATVFNDFVAYNKTSGKIIVYVRTLV